MTDRQGRRRLAATISAAVLVSTGTAFAATLSPAAAAPAAATPTALSDLLSTDGDKVLAASFDQQDSTVARGEQFSVSGRISTLSGDEVATLDDGVPATFTLEVVDPSGAVLATQEVTAGEQGTFDTTVPGSVTAKLPRNADATVIAVRAVDASYEDYEAADAGAAAVTVAAADTALRIENSFVSSVGWVKPGETYPSRIILTNPDTKPVNDVKVTIGAPRGTDFTGARAALGAVKRTADTVTWTLNVPKGAEDGPSTTTLVLEHQADTLGEEPTLVWRDLSTRAKLAAATGNQTVYSHGPRVIPQGEQYDTARYGDRPFPVVPVDYLDRKHQPEHTGEMLSDKINSRELIGSTFNLFQEMSLGQLFPEGTVPSAGIATAGFDYEPGFPFTQPEPQGTCKGITVGEEGAGTPLYSERIKDGFYQLPGQTEYYGSDKYGSAVVGAAVPGAGVLFDIDSGCGPVGKLVADSAAIADPEIDYSDYDTDKDGLVDFFMVVYAGCGGHGESQLSVVGCPYGGQDAVPYDNIWPHSSSLEYYYTDEETGLPGFETDDQLKNGEGAKLYYTNAKRNNMTTEKTEFPVMVRVGPYNVNPETAIDKASVISHEYGHSLGLPDFYSLGDRETYGDWNLMATDKSQNMDVFSRVEMGWVVPEVLTEDRTVDNFTDSKQDTHEIHWKTADGTPYTLSGPKVHNSLAFLAKLPGRQLIDPAKFDTGDKASKSHAWWSGSGNDFGCAPDGGHNLDFVIPGIEELPEGSTVQLDLKSAFDIEWDYDYGFVLTSTDGGKTFTSHASERDTPTTTPAATNPNANGCQSKYGNGITGSSASYTDPVTVQIDRTTGNYPDYIFIADQFDVSDLAGAEQPVLRFSYATDPGLARPGWFIDDLKVTATTPAGKKILLETDFEGEGGPDDPRVLNGGCTDDFGTQCTKGWNFVDASSEAPADHAYLMEMRDRSGFDNEGNGENDRAAIDFLPGLSLVYTDEAHGYGNVGTDNPPAQSPLDSQPEPGSDQPDLSDAAWTAANGDNTFTDSGEGHTDNYTDPANTETDSRYPDVDNPWRFRYDCLTFNVLSMSGEDLGPEVSDGNLTGAVKFDMNKGCGAFDYGYEKQKPPPPPENTAPTAAATATPETASTGEEITFSGSGSTDKESPDQLDYSWDFDDGGSRKDASGVEVKQAFDTPGQYDVELTVTDAQGLTAVDTVTVTITGEQGENTKPQAEASSSRKSAKVGNPFELSSEGSSDAESENLDYSWSFGNGGDEVDSTEPNPTVTYEQAGRYTITLTVTDEQGESDTDQIRVWARDHVGCESDRVDRSPGWKVRESDDAANGQYCYTPGRATMTMDFTGPRVKLHWGQAKDGGTGIVRIDGKQVGVLDFSTGSKKPVFRSDRAFGRLGEGEHELTLEVRGGAGYVDKMVLDR